MNDKQDFRTGGGGRWRRRAWAVLLLPVLAGPLGCQAVGGWHRIRMPILTGPFLTGSCRVGPPAAAADGGVRTAAGLLADSPQEGGKIGKAPPDPGAAVPGGEEPSVIPPGVAADCLDLSKALALAGVENPTIGLAEEAIRASLAEQLQARALLLPSLDAGVSYNLHRGPLQSGQGAILDVNRQSLYGGAGAFAVGGGTVGIPGVHLYADVADAVFEPRVAREQVAGRRFDAAATQNAVLLEVTTRYFTLVEAEARVRAVRQSEAEFQQAADLTAHFAHTGQGRQADADRAKGDALLLHNTEQRAEEDEAVASAELAQLLNRDPAVRLHTPGGPIPTVPLVDPGLGLEALVGVALDNRPEMAARSADVALNAARLREERFRPLLPVLSVGYSAGQFGGGSDTTDPRFGNFSNRTDFDAIAFWSLENLGVGNWARQKRRRAEVGEAQEERVRTVDRIRREVADAYAASAARLREVDTAGRQVMTAGRAFQEDLKRARNLEAWPIEVLDSLQLLNSARLDLIRALVGFDEAQFQLFVALGRPPTLAHYAGQPCPTPAACQAPGPAGAARPVPPAPPVLPQK